MKNFVIAIDVQGDFMWETGALPVPGAAPLLAPMAAWLAALTPEETAGVLFTLDTHIPDVYAASAEATQFPPHCVRETPGWALLPDPATIDPAIPRWRLEKGVFDMWTEDGVMIEPIDAPGRQPIPREAFFEGLKRAGVEQVTVIGVAADFCVRWAIDGLVARGFRVTVPAALTRGIVRQIDAVVADEWPGRVALA